MTQAARYILIAITSSLTLIAILVLITMLHPVKGSESMEMWDPGIPMDIRDIPTLTFTEGRDFRILVFADTQLWPRPLEVRKTRKIIEGLVRDTNPDFIATVGDNTATLFGRSLTKKVVRWFEDLETPWGVVLGNHDGEGIADRVWFGNRYEEADNSLFRSGPTNVFGIGNYGVNIVDAEGNPVYGLVMMDSNTYRHYESGRDYDFIHRDQVSWYEWYIEGLEAAAGGPVPSLLFFHIPLPEMDEARQAWENGELEGFGGMRERVFCPPVNSGFFDAVKAAGSTTHIFNGHDHVNSLSVEWEGIRMTYVLKTGPGSYSDKDLQGGTLITIDGDSREVSVEHLYYTR